jgi:hypothetical protein
VVTALSAAIALIIVPMARSILMTMASYKLTWITVRDVVFATTNAHVTA